MFTLFTIVNFVIHRDAVMHGSNIFLTEPFNSRE